MTEKELRSIRDHIEECLIDGIVKQLMITLTPIVEKVNLLVGGQKDLARRVEAQERQYRELKEDYVRVLGLLYERGLEPGNVWGKIDTSQVATTED